MVAGDDAALTGSVTQHPLRILREWQFWAVAAMALAIYFSRIADLPIRGEETRRAMVAWEMLQSGDFVVPRQQGQPFLSRPPAGSWPIAGLISATGKMSLWEVRLPTILATLAMILLVYCYARQFLSPLGALTSALAYATSAQVLQLGRIAETEATFTLPLASAFLLWHWGYIQRWRPWKTWSIAYTLVAAAMLVKSLQAPIYFCGAVGLYLAHQRDWRYLFGKAHLAGMLIFVTLIAAWQIPFYEQLGWSAVRQVWASDVQMRLTDLSLAALAIHIATFPLQVAACMLPWSLLLPAYAWPEFHSAMGKAKSMVTFLAIAWLVALPTCWLFPNAKPRYLMPIYPLAAPLVGLVVQRIIESSSDRIPRIRLGWLIWTGGLVVAILGGSAIVAGASWIHTSHLEILKQPKWFAALYLAAAVIAAVAISRQWKQWTPRGATMTICSAAAFLGLTATGVATNSLIAASAPTSGQIAQLRERLPPGETLASFGKVGTIFSYYWGKPIDLASAKMPTEATDTDRQINYFCFNWRENQPPQLPFPWRVEAVINCDRQADASPDHLVIVGRRIEAVTLHPDDTTLRR